MKHPRLHILELFLFLQLTLLVTSTVTAASSCDDVACPAVVIPLPKECKIRETHEIPEDICTCVWDQCSCGYSCRFPQCSHTNTTVTCLVEPCATKDCQYGCTNDYCTGCNGYCWEKPYNPTAPTTTASPTDPTSPPNPPCARMCPAVVVPLPDGCEIRNVNATSECLCDWDQCSCGWQCSIPTATPCPNPVQCLIDPCSTTKCDEGTRCQSNYCGACTATCVPEADCPNPVQCLVDPCSTKTCDAGTTCKSSYCGGCTATCIPNASNPTGSTPDCPNPVQCLIHPCATMLCAAGTVCEANYCYGCNATCKPIPTEKPIHYSNDTSSSCLYNGHIYLHGQMIQVECNTCICTNGSMICTGKACISSSTSGIRNDTCIYNGQTYTHGQSTQSTDGCNTCTCTNQGMACTLMACSSTGINNNITCTAFGRTYTPGQKMLSLDGCNTCQCGSDGQIECTLIACLNNTATYIGVTPTILFATTVTLAMIV